MIIGVLCLVGAVMFLSDGLYIDAGILAFVGTAIIWVGIDA